MLQNEKHMNFAMVDRTTAHADECAAPGVNDEAVGVEEGC
jgi:hypothetical protein